MLISAKIGVYVQRSNSKIWNYRNKNTGRRRNFRSKPLPIHVPVHKSELNFSYSRRHFSWLSQAVSKILIRGLSQKFSYDFMMIYPVVNGFSTNEVMSYLHIFYHSMITFVKRGFCLGFSDTSHVESLDRLRKSVVENVYNDIENFNKNSSQEENNKL